ncbi:MAG: DsrE family protein [Gammaproteobacteria bacterium]|nr:DsrE family protein [Gammaproteobacteria bacterium]
MKKVTMGIILAGAMLTAFGSAVAGDKHKVVIQVSSADATTQKIALNNAVNVQKDLGMDNVDIEIVAYGPGLSLLTAKSEESPRVKSLAMQNITFSACGNTMKKVAKKTGKEPKLTEGVKVVSAGVIRIMELQEDGYSYIRP